MTTHMERKTTARLSDKEMEKIYRIRQRFYWEIDFISRCRERKLEEIGLCNLPYQTLPEEKKLLDLAYTSWHMNSITIWKTLIRPIMLHLIMSLMRPNAGYRITGLPLLRNLTGIHGLSLSLRTELSVQCWHRIRISRLTLLSWIEIMRIPSFVLLLMMLP